MLKATFFSKVYLPMKTNQDQRYTNTRYCSAFGLVCMGEGATGIKVGVKLAEINISTSPQSTIRQVFNLRHCLGGQTSCGIVLGGEGGVRVGAEADQYWLRSKVIGPRYPAT